MPEWKPLPIVRPGEDSRAWEKEKIGLCVYDVRKWVKKKDEHPTISCSGLATHWIEGWPYGYCERHWMLRETGEIFSAPVVPNPLYGEFERERDRTVTMAFWEKK